MQLRPDLLEPDVEGFNTYKDVYEMIKEAVAMECDGAIIEGEAMGGTTRGGPTTKVKEEEGV